MNDSTEKLKKVSKWLIGTFTCCILIYLAISHINNVAGAAVWLLTLVKPLVIGVILALIFNVPMSFFERTLKTRTKLCKGVRALSIVLALVLVFGIFVGVILLVIPELVAAVKLIIQIVSSGLEQLAQLETNASLEGTPIGKYLGNFDIDWLELKNEMEIWVKSKSGLLVNQAVGAAGSLVNGTVSFFIGLVFAIYILSGKEKLKKQIGRLIHIWLPEKFGNTFIHVSVVCSRTFRLFIAGQATEAIILGTLCIIGMAILRIPYAPMIGALVGVTALIPIVGAFVGTIIGTIMILTVNPLKAVVFVIFFLILQQVEGNLIYPRVVGSKINLPAIWVLAAVTIGGNLGGPIGMLLGVPAASAAYALIKEFTEAREKKKA